MQVLFLFFLLAALIPDDCEQSMECLRRKQEVKKKKKKKKRILGNLAKHIKKLFILFYALIHFFIWALLHYCQQQLTAG